MLSIKDLILATPGVFNRWSESAQATRLGTRKCPNYNLQGIFSDVYSETFQELKYQAVLLVILDYIRAPQNYTKISPGRRQVGISGFHRLYLPINEKLWDQTVFIVLLLLLKSESDDYYTYLNVEDKWKPELFYVIH